MATQTTHEPVSAILNVRPQLGSTNEENRNSFGNFVRKFGPYKVWNIVNELSNTFNSVLHPQLRSQLNEKRSSIRPPRHYRGPKDPSHALRCYMIGLTRDRASPHIAIICKEAWFCTQARRVILESGLLHDTRWRGCVRLLCEIRQNGDTSPKLERMAERRPLQGNIPSKRNQHIVAISNFPKDSQLFCGLRIAISGVDGYVRMATLGGFIEVNDALYGLSVSHAFSAQTPIYDNTAHEFEDNTKQYIFEESDLDPLVQAADSSEESSAEDSSVEEQRPYVSKASKSYSSSSHESVQALEADDILSSPKSGNESMDSFSSRRLTTELATWSLGSWETFGNADADQFEWALISIDKDHFPTELDSMANFATTSSEEKIAVASVATEIAPAGTDLLLTSPTGAVKAIAISSVSSVQLNSWKRYLSLWSVQLDRVEDGDCGSWIVDSVTGELFGILVATCEAVCEAYILPIKDIFKEIEKISGHSARLPFSRPLSVDKGSVLVSESEHGKAKDSTFTPLRDLAGLYLLLPRDSIRIATLLPGESGSKVHCQLSIINLSDSVDYEVLSCALEREKSESSIYVNGRSVLASSYVKLSLDRLRYTDRPRILWVDALCVNHEDKEERSSQACLVNSIITRASNVCIWLGDADPIRDWPFSSYDQLFSKSEHMIKRYGPALAVDTLSSLVDRAWFHLGNIQAICLARNATMYCGRESMPWKAFTEVITRLATEYLPDSASKRKPSLDRDVHQDLELLYKFVNAIEDINRRLDDGQLVRRYSLEYLVMEFCSWIKSTTHHDVIYQMLSLARDAFPSPRVSMIPHNKESADESSPPREVQLSPAALKAVELFRRPLVRRTLFVDYAQSFEYVCRDFVQIAIQNSQSLDVLCRPWAPQYDNLPSWVPEKTKSPLLGKDHTMQYNSCSMSDMFFVSDLVEPGRYQSYNASGTQRPNFCMSDSSIGVPRISVKGFTLDAVQAKQSPALMGNIPPGWVDFLGWKNSNGPPPDKAWRTLIGDRDFELNPPPAALYRRVCESVFQGVEPGYGLNIKHELRRSRRIHAEDFLNRVEEVIWGRRLIRTEKHSFVGLAPGTTKKRDVVAILYGLSVPVVLRQVENAAKEDNVYTLVGECFIYGMMEGEALDFKKAQRIVDQTFVLE